MMKFAAPYPQEPEDRVGRSPIPGILALFLPRPSWARFPAAVLFLLAGCGAPGGQAGINVNICNSANSAGDCEQTATNTNVKQTEVAGTENPPPPPPTELDFVNEFLRGEFVIASRMGTWLDARGGGAPLEIPLSHALAEMVGPSLAPANAPLDEPDPAESDLPTVSDDANNDEE